MRDYVKIATAYAAKAAVDTSRHGYWNRAAAKRFLIDLERAKNKACPFLFSRRHAGDVCDFIEKLPHVEGDWGSPTIRLEPWQVFSLANVFGFRRRSDGGRRFSTVYFEVARKNGKSALTSGIALYCLCCEGEPGPQVKAAATTGDQARIVFDVAKAMVEKTPDLRDAFGVEALANAIVCHSNSGNMKPINAKASTQDGLNPHLNIIDELHAHKDRKLFDVLKSAQGARKNPLAWYITTAGYNVTGVCYEQRTMLIKILDGVVEADHYWGCIWTLDDGDDWRDEAVWIKANPNYGVSIRPDKMREECLEARESPASENEFLTKRCNKWLSSAANWLSMPNWDRCKWDGAWPDFTGNEVWIGADLSSRDDMTAVALVWQRDGALWTRVQYFLPEDVIAQRVEKGLAFYSEWARDGTLTATPGDWIDRETIEAYIREQCERYKARMVVCDTYGIGPDIMASLTADGIPAGQLYFTARNMGPAALELEARVKSSARFWHDGNAALKWNASNTFVERRVDGSILPKKESSMSQNKIDGVAALIMAMSQMRFEEDAPKVVEIKYEPGGLFL